MRMCVLCLFNCVFPPMLSVSHFIFLLLSFLTLSNVGSSNTYELSVLSYDVKLLPSNHALLLFILSQLCVFLSLAHDLTNYRAFSLKKATVCLGD